MQKNYKVTQKHCELVQNSCEVIPNYCEVMLKYCELNTKVFQQLYKRQNSDKFRHTYLDTIIFFHVFYILCQISINITPETQVDVDKLINRLPTDLKVGDLIPSFSPYPHVDMSLINILNPSWQDHIMLL